MAETTIRADRAELMRRVERAEKLLQKGKAAEALEEYLLVLRDDPENDKVRELSADLCLAQSRGRDAARLLGELFERQVNAGDATRASLTYKKLARHGNPTWEQKFRFGQLLEGSNKKLAVGTYESALSDLAKLDNKNDALQILSRLVELEPIQANVLRIAEKQKICIGNNRIDDKSFVVVIVPNAEANSIARKNPIARRHLNALAVFHLVRIWSRKAQCPASGIDYEVSTLIDLDRVSAGECERHIVGICAGL